jgi:hypothetical protein
VSAEQRRHLGERRFGQKLEGALAMRALAAGMG